MFRWATIVAFSSCSILSICTAIYLQMTDILADIVTLCWQFITKEAYAGIKSYESIHKWLRQQHFISKDHRKLRTNCMLNITRQGSRHLLQPLGARTTPPTTIRPYRMAGDILFTQQQDGSWLQHDQHIDQQQTRSTQNRFEEVPSEHRTVDVQHRGTILIAEHNNLPEVETPQNINEEA